MAVPAVATTVVKDPLPGALATLSGLVERDLRDEQNFEMALKAVEAVATTVVKDPLPGALASLSGLVERDLREHHLAAGRVC